MRQVRRLWVAPLLMWLPLTAGYSVGAARELTFEQRVEAQRAIAQVYYRHQIGATLPFDQAVPRRLLEAKVAAYLKATAGVPPDRLAAEAERVARGSRMSERLSEISAALGYDWELYLEAFIRPLLATPRSEGSAAGATAVTCAPDGVWDNGILDDPPKPPLPRSGHSAIWIGSEMIVWGGVVAAAGYESRGERYDPVTDTWTVMSTLNAPPGLSGHTSVWTGSRVLIWEGATGGIYDPASDTWTSISTMNAPALMYGHSAFWTGSEMLIWGASDLNFQNMGALYNPATDSWRSISTTNAPATRGYAAVWTGSQMVVWGGYDAATHQVNSGARYSPATNSWISMSQANAPAARASASTVWTGSEMIIWGGDDYFSGPLRTGGHYNPVTDAWTGMSAPGAPSSRYASTAVWTGSAMIMWGGSEYYSAQDVQTGGRYSPATNSWTATAVSGAPDARNYHTAVWTGSTMIVFGGANGIDSGGRYYPGTDSWLPTKREGFGAGAGVWTGNDVLIWDGQNGGRYSPVTDSWAPISEVGAPSRRTGHVAVWSGMKMIVWGGYEFRTYLPLDTGGLYNPFTDSWTPMSTAGAPPPRGQPSAVWTDSEMIVWGGWDPRSANAAVGTGGRYDPATDSWASTSMTGAPTPRASHTAVWTGSEMIVWGGSESGDSCGGEFDTGARYDPDTDTWTPTPLTGAPSVRKLHTAVWTGTEMVVFGGDNYQYPYCDLLNTGGRFNPSTNTWSPISTAGSIFSAGHGAVWTGSSMLVMGGYYGWENPRRYDPATDTWHAIATSGEPTWQLRWLYDNGSVALWTGEMVFVWTGHPVAGGRYFPGASLADDDTDGVRVCDGDCDDGNAAVWATPGEVPLLDVAATGPGGAAELSWTAPAPAGGLSPAYDTIRSPGPMVFSGPQAACVESGDGSDTMALDIEMPLPGNVFYYLVRAENACPAGQGSLGTTSSGGPRSARSCP